MRKLIKPLLILSLVTLAISCKKDAKVSTDTKISQDVLNKISALGFSSKNVIQDEDGYIVAGDILLTPEHLNSSPFNATLLRIAGEEQYRTFNLVTALPR